jgi:polyisoprenoid-binding protein YceI
MRMNYLKSGFFLGFMILWTLPVWAGVLPSNAIIKFPTTVISTSRNPHSKKPWVQFTSGSEVWIEGNSTLHRFYLSATKVFVSSQVHLASHPESLLTLIEKNQIHNLKITIPVQGLTSGEKGLDQNAYKTMKAAKHPNIVFRLNNYLLTPFPDHPNTYGLLAQGNLKIAGHTRSITLHATLVYHPTGITIYGCQTVRQKDYGITPFSMVLFLTTSNKIIVHYLIRLKMKK